MTLPQHLSAKIALLFLLLIMVITASITAVFTYFLLSLITPHLFVSLPLTVAALAGVTYFWLRLLANMVQATRPRGVSALLTVMITLTLFVAIATPTLQDRLATPEESSEQVPATLPAYTIPLATVDAENGFTDLQPLRPVLQEKRIVALGEASHGTSEFFRMKHRLLEFLVCEMGYQHFGMELSPADGQRINAYIMGEDSRPESALYWPWATVEVMEMIEWMRRYNAQPHKPFSLTFHGIDPRVGYRDQVMADNVTHILAESGPDSKIVLWAHNLHISRTPGLLGYYMQENFADDAYLLGFEFDHGRFTSRMGTVHTYPAGPTTSDFYAHDLAHLDSPILFLDFATMVQEPILHDWLAADRRSWDLQELHAIFRLFPARHIQQTSWLQLYDGLIFVEESTPAVSLRHYQNKPEQDVCQN